jgi:thiamine biosynthesis lipoprotein ApbE
MLRVDGVYRVWQSPPGEPHWTLDIPDPREPTRPLLRLRASNRAVAVCGQRQAAETSGQQELRRLPMIDPRDGRPAASDLLAVVAVADSAADAAALCRTLYVAGALEGTDFFRKTRRAEAVLLVRSDGASPYVVASASLRRAIELSEELRAETAEDVRYLLPPASL